MKPGDVVAAIRRRYWIIIALVLIAALTGAIVSSVQTPVYEARIQLSAQAPAVKGDAATIFAYVASMQAIMNSAMSLDVANATSAKLAKSGIKLSPEVLLGKVSGDFVVNTNALNLDFSDSSPTRVAEIANAWGEEASRMLSSQPLLLGGQLVLTNRALPPRKPTMPNPFAYVGLGAFLGLILGGCLTMGLEYFDPHFRSSRETEDMLGLPVIGILPRGKTLTPLSNSVYTNIRTSLFMSREGQGCNSILVTSAMPDTEKDQANTGARVSVALAMSIARAGRKTLLVDCGLKGGAVSSLLKADNLLGLADAIEKEEPLEGLIAETSTANLSLLPAGREPLVPSDLLSSPLFQRILHGFQDEYDTVVLDGPPLSVSMDAAIVAKSTSSSLVVIDVRNCTRNAVLAALENFDRLEIKPTGVVLTNVKLDRLERVLENQAQ